MVCNRQRRLIFGANQFRNHQIEREAERAAENPQKKEQSGNALIVANQNQRMEKNLKLARVLDVARDVVEERRSASKLSNSTHPKLKKRSVEANTNEDNVEEF